MEKLNLNQPQNRNYGIDLLRIVSMLMVVILHILSHGGILQKAKMLTWGGESVWLLRSLCFGAVNCYALISGYVGITARYKYSNIISLWLQVLFYSIFLSFGEALFVCINGGEVSIKSLIKGCFPFVFSQYWYFTAYVCLFFFMPIFNHILNTLSRSILKRMGIFVCFAFCGAALLYDLNKGVNSGLSFLWISIMYLLGGYIAKYDPLKSWGIGKSLCGYFFCAMITFLGRIVIEMITLQLFGVSIREDILYAYNSITVVGESVFLFNAFKQLKINIGMGKLIAFLAQATFGVYLIHENPIIKDYFIRNQFGVLWNISSLFIVELVMVFALVIFIICMTIDLVRIVLFKLLNIKKLSVWIENAIRKIAWLFFKVLFDKDDKNKTD